MREGGHVCIAALQFNGGLELIHFARLILRSDAGFINHLAVLQ